LNLTELQLKIAAFGAEHSFYYHTGQVFIFSYQQMNKGSKTSKDGLFGNRMQKLWFAALLVDDLKPDA